MKEIYKDVYLVGSSGCEVYLVDTHSEEGLVLIDCGMDLSIIQDISKKGFDPLSILHCIITHCHIDHIAACAELKKFNPKIKFYAHELDAEAIEKKGFDNRTAASWYGKTYTPVQLNTRFKGGMKALQLGDYEFKCIHTPGHTPGSIAVVVDISNKRILFGQDIHGPFYESFGSNLEEYQASMKKLLDLKPDILCEGHFGIIKPADEVKKYIEGYMKRNRP
ncbi:MAG: Metallo-beta-lactamase L1 [Promethearchaeota archaeon]|nr:MAG: Metallo-beta-lactamase L1 [Candidatus Lokiarchaeota archaeon]